MPGQRSHDWRKVKATLSDDFVIGGYTQGYGSRAHSFGALLLGYYDENDALVYAGHVGSGFDDPVLAELRESWILSLLISARSIRRRR